MIKGIDPLLTPDLLHALAAMGQGDGIVVADANFTAARLASGKPLILLPGIGIERVVRAVLSLLPLDEAVTQPVANMQVSGRPEGWASALQRGVIDALAVQGHARPDECEPVERIAFYERARSAFAVVLTGELQPFATFLFRKGVIGEPLAE